MHSWIACQSSRRLIRRSFVDGEIPARKADRLLAHLRRCTACRNLYDRVVRAQRLCEHENMDEPSRMEFGIWAQRVIETALQPSDERSEERRPLLAWRFAAAGLALVLVVVGSWLWLRSGPRDTFQTRGEGPVLAVRSFCETVDLGGRPLIRSLSEDPTPQELAACPANGILRFAYRTPHPGFLYVLARTPSGEVLWLMPQQADDKPIRIQAAGSLTPLPLVLPAASLPGTGHYEMIFVLAREDSLRNQVHDLVSGAAFDPSALAAGTEADAVVVRRVVLDPGPGEKR